VSTSRKDKLLNWIAPIAISASLSLGAGLYRAGATSEKFEEQQKAIDLIKAENDRKNERDNKVATEVAVIASWVNDQKAKELAHGR